MMNIKLQNSKTTAMKAGFLFGLLLLMPLAGCLGADDNEDADQETLVIAYEVRDDYATVDENPQALADYLSTVLDMKVELYNSQSEGAMLEALRFGNADIAIMDGGAAWVGWQQYGLDVLAADQKSDGRTHYTAHAWVLNDSAMAEAALDDDPETDPFALLEGTTSCHTGWLKSAGMLFPMGYLIGQGYAEVVGDEDDIESLRNTIFSFFNENASIPESGTPYHGYAGAVKCLSEGRGDVAFAKDSTVDAYCANANASENEAWCLDRDRYVALPAFGQAPSHPVMYNPDAMDAEKAAAVRAALVGMSADPLAASVLEQVLNTPGLVGVTAEEHLGTYSEAIIHIPGIEAYFDGKYDIENA